ncbi:MAG: serine protease [Labilithrix sp.]
MRRVALALASTLLAVGCSRAPSTPETEGASASLIVGGKLATVESYEGIIQTENDAQGAWCGATLIASEWAVTAAHCVFDDLEMGGFQRVVLGRQATNDGTGETIDVVDVIRHEAYDNETHANDIALLHLGAKSKHEPVRLVTKAAWPKLAAAGTDVTVVGWGATAEGGGMSNTLRQVTVPIVSTSTCNQQYEGIIDSRQVCAGLPGGGKDSCQGDSGGPLFEKVDGVNVQVGIVSFGEGCGEANFAGVYTSVAMFRDWIEQNTGGVVPAVPKAEPKPSTPDDHGGDESADDTGSSTSSKTGSSHTPRTSTNDGDEDGDEPDRDEDDTPSSSKKKSSAGPAAAACQMSRGRQEGGDIGIPGRALVLLAAFSGLALRRYFKRKKTADAFDALGDGPCLEEVEASEAPVRAASRRRLRKLGFGRGGIVKHERAG